MGCRVTSVNRTPIQNRLGDLATLLKFLKVYPYSEKRAFETDIANLWKYGRDEEAVKRLKRLGGCLLLRRPKGILDLPPRHDLRNQIDLSLDERQLYEGIRSQALAKIDEALAQANPGTKSHSFVNVLQRIEALRMVCNLGLHYHDRHEIDTTLHVSPTSENWETLAQRTVVFSTWRMTLNLIEVGLKQASIRCLRFDGKAPQKERQAVVDRFRRDPSIKVLLLTLSCGAVGLTLTAACRAYLMEPHWNPTLEDQSLARIHRMGQKKELTTIRFVVKNSFEERVIEIQDFKRDLASVLLNPQGESGFSTRNKPLEVS
ncbi:hypothetical protein QBC38DRAFT_519432 [Podospora fimiseda]|uniref:Helicase C-terminal domain-containing protein n=1 Tax=Podospora fimiseda TaxID=252190 RepID=A0AAN6YST4_9PEZI|nr:hypothetical protein QBC38DRAFT_519432 [Podospora fimiseda]